MTFAAILYEGYLDDVQEAAEALRHWHAQRLLAESTEIEASAPVEYDDDELEVVLADFTAAGVPEASERAWA